MIDLGFVFTLVSVPTSIYGTYELLKKVIYGWKRFKSKSIVWQNNRDWVIIVPQYTGSYCRIEDIKASEEIHAHCSKIGLNCIIQDDTQPIPPNKNLIMICGPKANKVTKELYKYFKINFNMNANPVAIHDSIGNCDYVAETDSCSGFIKKDFAVLTRYIETGTRRNYIFCAGTEGVGTIGAAHMLTEYKLTSYIKKLRALNQSFLYR